MLFAQALRPSERAYTETLKQTVGYMLHAVCQPNTLKHSIVQPACCLSTRSAGAHHSLGSYTAAAYLLVAGPMLLWWPGRQPWLLVSSATIGLPAQQQSWFFRYLGGIRSLLVHGVAKVTLQDTEPFLLCAGMSLLQCKTNVNRAWQLVKHHFPCGGVSSGRAQSHKEMCPD